MHGYQNLDAIHHIFEEGGPVKVNFNTLRLQLIKNYNELITKLQKAENPEGIISISAEDIAPHIEVIRNSIIVLGCIEDKEDSDCQCVITDAMVIKSLSEEKIVE